MPDTTQADNKVMNEVKKKSLPVHDRMKTIVTSLQDVIAASTRFRPADVSAARDYDESITVTLLKAVVELSAIAAVDRRADAVAIELHRQRREFALAQQKLRDQTDIAMQQQSQAINKAILPFIDAKGAAS